MAFAGLKKAKDRNELIAFWEKEVSVVNRVSAVYGTLCFGEERAHVGCGIDARRRRHVARDATC